MASPCPARGRCRGWVLREAQRQQDGCAAFPRASAPHGGECPARGRTRAAGSVQACTPACAGNGCETTCPLTLAFPKPRRGVGKVTRGDTSLCHPSPRVLGGTALLRLAALLPADTRHAPRCRTRPTWGFRPFPLGTGPGGGDLGSRSARPRSGTLDSCERWLPAALLGSGPGWAGGPGPVARGLHVTRQAGTAGSAVWQCHLAVTALSPEARTRRCQGCAWLCLLS